MVEEFEEIDDEETRDSLFRLHGIMLARDTELVSIANKCTYYFEFKKLIREWFKDTDVVFSSDELKIVWGKVVGVDDLVNMRKED